MFKFNNSLRFKSIFLDLCVLCVIGVLTSTLYFIYYGKFDHLYFYNFEMSLLFSLFFCKDIIGGQSIGKRFFKLKVVNNKINEGEKVVENLELNSIRLILRNLFVYIWPIEILLLMYQDKRLGDAIIKTKVVSFDNQRNTIKNRDIIKNLFIFILVFVITLLLNFSSLFLLS